VSALDGKPRLTRAWHSPATAANRSCGCRSASRSNRRGS
jgi:hypothetical protein